MTQLGEANNLQTPHQASAPPGVIMMHFLDGFGLLRELRADSLTHCPGCPFVGASVRGVNWGDV
jgi:hypothetical protein